METAQDTQALANELGAPRPLPTPQTAALTTGADTQGTGVDALAAPPPMGQTIAQNTIDAGQVNHGDSRDWAENTVAGVQAALAGFGAPGKVPAGAGALYGVGAAARQQQAQQQEKQKMQLEQNKVKTEQQQRQQQIDIEQRRVGDQEQQFGKEYDLKLAENARQQAQNVREMSEHDARLIAMDDAHSQANFQLMHEDLAFRQGQLDREEALKAVGAKPVVIAGKPAPEFSHLGEAEDFAMANKLGADAHNNGYRTRINLDADGKYRLYEVPDAGPDWHTVKDANGKPTKIFADPLGVLNYQEKVSQVHEAQARTSLSYAEAKKDLDAAGLSDTAKNARKELDKVGGDLSKLSPGSREALQGDAFKHAQLAFNMYTAAQRDMQKDPDFPNLQTNPQTGNVDTGSKEYKDLAAKYHVEEANELMGSAYDEVRKLGIGYQPFGQQKQAPALGTRPFQAVNSLNKNPTHLAEGLPQPPQKGAPINAQAFREYLQQYNGDLERAKNAAIGNGWGPPTQTAQ